MHKAGPQSSHAERRRYDVATTRWEAEADYTRAVAAVEAATIIIKAAKTIYAYQEADEQLEAAIAREAEALTTLESFGGRS